MQSKVHQGNYIGSIGYIGEMSSSVYEVVKEGKSQLKFVCPLGSEHIHN